MNPQQIVIVCVLGSLPIMLMRMNEPLDAWVEFSHLGRSAVHSICG
jgi:hypothetical protein